MLQWMGGSRRKLNASRKSIHNKQKQYFEQRKRQQQAHVQVSQTDTMKEDREEPRSLDILNLANLAMIHNQDNEIPLPAPRKKVVCQYPNASGKGCSEPERLSMKISPPSDFEHYCGGKMDEVKSPTLSGGYNVEHRKFETNEQKEEIQNEVMILDLLIGDAEDIKPKARSAPENHVAFTIEGLGKVGMETPVHSPNVHKRGLPSPPRPSRHVHSSTKCKARPYYLDIQHDSAMCDMNIERYGNTANFICNSREEVDEIRSKKSMRVGGSHVFPDDFSDFFDDLSDDIEEIYCESINGNKTYTDCDHARKQNKAWGNDTFRSESFPFSSSNPASRNESGISSDYFRFERTAPKKRNTFDTSDFWKFSPSDPFASMLPLTDDNNHLSFDCDSDKKVNSISGMKSMFDSWSFPESEESHDCRSLLSEESCSSTAGGMKANGSNKTTMNDLPKSIGEKFNSRNIFGDGKDYSDISGDLCEKNIEETKKSSMPDFLASKSSSYLRRDFASRSLDTECISRAKDTVSLADMTCTPSFCINGNREANTTSSRSKPNFEANTFNMPSPPKMVALVGTKSKSAGAGEPLGSFHFDEPRQSSVSTSCLHKTAVCLSVTKKYSPCLSSAKVQHISSIPDLLGPENPKSLKKEEHGSTEKPLLSLTGAVDCHESSNDHQKSSNQDEPFFASKDRISDEGDSYEVLENSAQLKSVSGDTDRPTRLDASPRPPSEVGNKESVGAKKQNGTGIGIGGMECKQGNRSSTSHQVTLESYVLQFLCVQKVLLEASAKDA